MSGQGWDRALCHQAARHDLSEHSATKEPSRNEKCASSVCSTCRNPFPDPQESLLAPVEEGTLVREPAGLVCSAAEFPLIYLDIFLDIPRKGSLTNASTPRVKRF